MSGEVQTGNRNAPKRSHWPILTVDYEKRDCEAGCGDAYFMDLGQSTWNKEEISAKIWRRAQNRWSRQSEELPLSRVLDLAILVAAAMMNKKSSLCEFVQDGTQKEQLDGFIEENMQLYAPKLEDLRRVLQPTTQDPKNTNVPNIFSFASSELSQDAVLAWLLSWADAKYAVSDTEIHRTAVNFVRLLTGIQDLKIDRINVGRQWEHIDIWAEINDDIFLTIEDKTDTTIHDEQLQRYRACVEKEYPHTQHCFAYVKTGNEPNCILEEVKKAGYRVVCRPDILKCLDEYRGENVIIRQYREFLRVREDATNSFKTLPITEWCWSAWEGFYKELEGYGKIDTWGYVPNPSGGFLGANWYWVDFSSLHGQMYLQFEQLKLCFKVWVAERTCRSEKRNESSAKLLEIASKNFPEIKRPNRFGAGEYMTIAVVDLKDIVGTERVNMQELCNKLEQYEKIIDECCLTL